MPDQHFAPEEIVRRGRALYEREIRDRIERDHHGEVVVIDIDTGDFEVNRDHLTAAKRLRARRSDAMLFATRVGFPALARIGARTTTRGA